MITLAEARAEGARRSLAEFVRQAWHVVEPSTPLVGNWHIAVICDRVQALMEGQLGKQNLIINVPPGSMKSTIISVCLPAWMWIHNPSWRGLFASGNEKIALRDSMKCRYILDSEWFKSLFHPDWQFASDQNAKGHYVNTKQGFRQSISAGSGITGTRGSAILVDDPNDAAGGKADRDAINSWWDDAAYNRLNDLKTGHRCIIQQRLHEEDLTGHILATDAQDWDLLVIRQEFELGDEQPWDPRTVEGELFFPARFPQEVVEAEKRIKGSTGYAGQHQQRPAPKEGAIFRRGYVKFYDPALPLPVFKRKIMSWDTAFKEKEENDPSCGLLAGETDLGIYLLDHTLGRMGYPALKEKAKTWAAAHHPTALLIEDKASGQSLIQELRQETSLPVVPIQVEADKVSRAWAIVPTWEAGRIYLPDGIPWVDTFLTELYTFPRSVHKDQVDAFTQLVRYLILGGGGTGMLEWLRQEASANEKPKDRQENGMEEETFQGL